MVNVTWGNDGLGQYMAMETAQGFYWPINSLLKYIIRQNVHAIHGDEKTALFRLKNYRINNYLNSSVDCTIPTLGIRRMIYHSL